MRNIENEIKKDSFKKPSLKTLLVVVCVMIIILKTSTITINLELDPTIILLYFCSLLR